MKPEMYFVTSNGDTPLKIYFHFEDALESGELYIDAFDSEGNHVQAYELDTSDYTSNF